MTIDYYYLILQICWLISGDMQHPVDQGTMLRFGKRANDEFSVDDTMLRFGKRESWLSSDDYDTYYNRVDRNDVTGGDVMLRFGKRFGPHTSAVNGSLNKSLDLCCNFIIPFCLFRSALL